MERREESVRLDRVQKDSEQFPFLGDLDGVPDDSDFDLLTAMCIATR